VIPAWLATCSVDGVPNVTVLSIVQYVDSERVALTRQFFNKTTADLDANPYAQALVVDPETGDQYLLDLRDLHTETEGPTFDAVAASLDAVASQTGMEGVFRPRGVDIHRMLESRALDEPGAGLVTVSPAGLEDVFVELGEQVDDPEPPAVEVMPPLDELVARSARAAARSPARRRPSRSFEEAVGGVRPTETASSSRAEDGERHVSGGSRRGTGEALTSDVVVSP
jgi:hypothetical protein